MEVSLKVPHLLERKQGSLVRIKPAKIFLVANITVFEKAPGFPVKRTCILLH